MEAHRALRRAGLGGAVPADRPGRRGPHLRGDHPRQLAVGQGRRRLRAQDRLPASTCRAACRWSSRRSSSASPTSAAASSPRPTSATAFKAEYLDREVPLELVGYRISSGDDGERIDAVIRHAGTESEVAGAGNGPIDAFVRAVHDATASRRACATTTSTRMGARRGRARRRLPRGRGRRADELGRRHAPEHRHRSPARRRLGGQPRARARLVGRRGVSCGARGGPAWRARRARSGCRPTRSVRCAVRARSRSARR